MHCLQLTGQHNSAGNRNQPENLDPRHFEVLRPRDLHEEHRDSNLHTTGPPDHPGVPCFDEMALARRCHTPGGEAETWG